MGREGIGLLVMCGESLAVNLPPLALAIAGVTRYNAECDSKVNVYVVCQLVASALAIIVTNAFYIVYMRKGTFKQGIDKFKKSRLKIIQGISSLYEFAIFLMGCVLVFRTDPDHCDPVLWGLGLGCVISELLGIIIGCCILPCVLMAVGAFELKWNTDAKDKDITEAL
ncbi:hypothetical protein Pelo_3875 [Pelomyxa schiedti]|nr:hypothetical protein Pelo_3875 [Pelomyxa schiedti]